MPKTKSFTGSLARRLVLSEFAKFSQSRLTICLPDGNLRTFGDSKANAGASMEIKNENAFRRIVLGADIGFAEGYIEGEWTSPNLNELISFFIDNIDQTPSMSGTTRKALGIGLFKFADRIGHILRRNDKRTVLRNIAEHYDLSNDFFQLFLDPSMMYSSARWQGATHLEEAQANKNESLCRLLQLNPTDHVLEIGTGWGGWAIHAAKYHSCRVTSLTISRSQFELAQHRIETAGLKDRITVRLEDFRDHQGYYDKCVSIEMMEALGHKYLPAFCAAIGRMLKPNGIVALQYITCPDSRYVQFRKGVDFIQKHIFPGSLLLSINRVGNLMTSKGGFQLERLEEFGCDYARTLDAWCQAFENNLDKVREMGFDERFIRKWRFYFRYCQAAFRCRNIGVVQTVYVRPNRKNSTSIQR